MADCSESESNDNNNLKSGQRQSRGRTCQVCGDKALGYNFNAVTCESCKAFFRRNALVKKEFTCPFNQNCEISVVTRRFCQKCRLQKCFTVGMKKEYILSDSEKIEKRKKIEQNRAKRRPNSTEGEQGGRGKKIKSEEIAWSPNTDLSQDTFTVCSPEMFQQSSTSSSEVLPPPPQQQQQDLIPSIPCQVPAMTPSEIVSRIICEPEKSSQAINALMPTQQEALKVMTIVINSPTDALRLIDHFIQQPGDALTIISKIMNSALDALSVFIQFMSSPTDALQIINKIMNSPSEVLQFLQQLMKFPQDALDVMTKFMNEPAEALKMINRMINNELESTTMMPEGSENEGDGDATTSEHDRLRKFVEGNLIKSIISTNTIEMAPALEGPQHQPATFNPFTAYVQLPSTSQPISAAAPTQVDSSICNNDQQVASSFEGEEIKSNEETIHDMFEEMSNVPNSLDSILCEAIKIEYGCLSSKPKSRELNDSEQAKLNELIVANKALYAPVDEDWANLINDNVRLKVSGL